MYLASCIVHKQIDSPASQPPGSTSHSPAAEWMMLLEPPPTALIASPTTACLSAIVRGMTHGSPDCLMAARELSLGEALQLA